MNAVKQKISAIIINCNDSEDLEQSMDAAFLQTVPFDEVIIVDDGSTDNSVEVIEARIQEIEYARLVKNPQNLGINKTLNIGIEECSGDFYYIISTGDKYNLGIVEKCHEALQGFPDVFMVAGNATVSNSDTGQDRQFVLPFPQMLGCYSEEDISAVAKKRNFTFFGGASFLKRNEVIKVGMHLDQLKWHADWFLYLVVAKRGGFALIPEEFIKINQSKGQYSSACNDWIQQKEVIKSFIKILEESYPEEYNFFRGNALLPTYDIQTLLLSFTNKSLRKYMTPLLVWRLLTYKPMRVVGRLIPNSFSEKIRKLVRV